MRSIEFSIHPLDFAYTIDELVYRITVGFVVIHERIESLLHVVIWD